MIRRIFMRETCLIHRITSLEKWGMRSDADFSEEGLRLIADAGFSGVFVNGGSGIGPDMIPPEALVEAKPLTDLMPRTIRGERERIARRCALLNRYALDPWLMFWGVPGPDRSADYLAAASNRMFDSRTKLEMTAKFRRSPEIFGRRSDQAVSWRGSRPLCISHPVVQEYYTNLATALARETAGYRGVLFFPGDSEPEMCDELCPRCSATGIPLWSLMCAHANRIYRGLQSGDRPIPFYFALWNQDLHGGIDNIQAMLEMLDPGIGICMSISDGLKEQRRSGPMEFSQPWSNVVDAGAMFRDAAELAFGQGRKIMVFGEIGQSEVWDPVCHNMPLPGKVLGLLGNAAKTRGVDAVCDFWGHRPPFDSHANFAAMRGYLSAPGMSVEDQLKAAAVVHYGIPSAHAGIVEAALGAWNTFSSVVDHWAIVCWGQRMSFAIGRVSARGRIYGPLVPPVLRASDYAKGHPGLHTIAEVECFLDFQRQDCLAFLGARDCFVELADRLCEAGCHEGANIARKEAANIHLAGELLVSQARFLLACRLFHNGGSAQRLGEIVEEEIEARERQLLISADCGSGAGINPIFVFEDIQNMRLFLSDDSFPDVPDDCFQLSPTPFTL